MNRQEYIEQLNHLYYDFNQAIPNEILHNIGGTHKVSSGWFQGIFQAMNLGKKLGINIQDIQAQFGEYLTQRGFYDVELHLTNEQDIFIGDKTLEGLMLRVLPGTYIMPEEFL